VPKVTPRLTLFELRTSLLSSTLVLTVIGSDCPAR